MSLDKAIEYGKEHRKPYRGTKSYDCTCRNHGSCEWCRQNRQHKFRDKKGDDTMRIETKYFADDDTEFESEEECRAYEQFQKDCMGAVAIFDDDMNYMDSPTLEEIESYAFYIFIRSGAKAESLFSWLKEQISFDDDGIKYPLVAGELYAFSADNGKWYDMDEQLASLAANVERMKRLGAEQ